LSNFRYHGNQGRSGTSLNDIIKLSDPENFHSVQESRTCLTENRVIANTAVKGISAFFGESGRPLLLVQFGADIYIYERSSVFDAFCYC